MAGSLEKDLEIANSESFLGHDQKADGHQGFKGMASRNSDEHPFVANHNSDKHPCVVVPDGHQALHALDATTTSPTACAISRRPSFKDRLLSIDVPLLACFAFWYAGNYYYNITNKHALNAAGGATGFPMTIATLQLGIGVIYALFLWVAPDARKRPTITFDDYVRTLPVGFTAAGAHLGSVFALSAGAVSFAQIVKAAEPVFAAVVGTCFYRMSVSTAKWLCLIPVIGGVILASVGELSFSWGALITASVANTFAAVKGNENKKLMDTEGLAERIGSVGNQFALTTINAFLLSLPLMLAMEGWKLGAFWELCKTSSAVRNNLVFSGFWFYLYNEVATMTIKKTNAVTQSVANTAKRVIVIIVIALVMGEHLGTMKLVGCTIGIGGVFLYSIIDKLISRCKR
jgi:solute carrier family 35 protein E1